MRTGNVKDKDRCINVYFARKNLEPKVNSKNYKMLHEMDCAFKVIFLNSYRSFCRNQRKKSLAVATTPKGTISVARLTVDPYVATIFL